MAQRARLELGLPAAGGWVNTTDLITTDLQNWSEVTQGIVAEGTMEFTDGHATNHAARFYRILPP